MKKEENHETHLVRRNRSEHGRVRNHHFGCGRLCRTSTHHLEKSGSAANAYGSRQIRSNCRWLSLEDRGSVTAEFAIVLPGVLLVLFMSLSVLSLQASRIALVEVAAEGARALARGESEQLVAELLDEHELGANTSFQASFGDQAVCVEVAQKHEIRAFGGLLPIEVKEVQCARKGGL